MNLPGVGGHQVCETVRAEARYRHLPILFITADKADATFLKGLQSGGDAQLVKPFDLEAFKSEAKHLIHAVT